MNNNLKEKEDIKSKGYKKIVNIDLKKLKGYKYVKYILAKKIILTYERKKHILNDHPNEFGKTMSEMNKTLKKPNEIRVSNKDNSELHFIRIIEKDYHIVIIKVNIVNNTRYLYNSVISSWFISDKNIKRFKNKSTIIYNKKNR